MAGEERVKARERVDVLERLVHSSRCVPLVVASVDAYQKVQHLPVLVRVAEREVPVVGLVVEGRTGAAFTLTVNPSVDLTQK
jgi:hypothetical protein